VLADIDELGDSITDSLTDGNRIYWSLAAGGVACYVAGRRLQSDMASAARAQHGKHVMARRHSGGWRPLRYPNVR
jgi:hypothetical protein